MDERIERAADLVRRAVFHDEVDGLKLAGPELDAVEADLALARAKLAHVRYQTDGTEDPDEYPLLQRAAELYRELGDRRGEAEALCWAGIFHQVIGGDHEAADPVLREALTMATDAGDKLTASYALRHLGVADHMAGRLTEARAQLEKSTRLRQEIEFLPGVAANLVGLTYIAAREGRRLDAIDLIAEARMIAASCGAHAILRQLEDAEKAL